MVLINILLVFCLLHYVLLASFDCLLLCLTGWLFGVLNGDCLFVLLACCFEFDGFKLVGCVLIVTLGCLGCFGWLLYCVYGFVWCLIC